MNKDYYAIPKAICNAQKAICDANDLMIGVDGHRDSVKELFRAFDLLQKAFDAEMLHAEREQKWDLQAVVDHLVVNHCY